MLQSARIDVAVRSLARTDVAVRLIQSFVRRFVVVSVAAQYNRRLVSYTIDVAVRYDRFSCRIGIFVGLFERQEEVVGLFVRSMQSVQSIRVDIDRR